MLYLLKKDIKRLNYLFVSYLPIQAMFICQIYYFIIFKLFNLILKLEIYVFKNILCSYVSN